MTSSCILGSVRLKKVENPNFFVFNPICLKFGIGGNFDMLITKSNPKLRYGKRFEQKNAIFFRFLVKILPSTLQQ